MSEVYGSTLKYIGLAIKEFTPVLTSLKQSVSKEKKQIEDLLDMYSDIASKIDKYKLNFDDPNRFFPGEPAVIEIYFPEKVWENLSRLVVRLLEKWKSDLADLKDKTYLTDKNKEKIYKLRELIWPLDATIQAKGTLFNKHVSKGALIFPGESEAKMTSEEAELQEIATEKTEDVPTNDYKIFPGAVIESVPGNLKVLCEEFNFNFQYEKVNAAMLLLRKILPLAIVKKFQQIGKEPEIKENGEFVGTKVLLNKTESIVSQRRIYSEVKNYKFLLDSSQHIFSLSPYRDDAKGAAIAIRAMLEDFFKDQHGPDAPASTTKLS